ncbi:hypothetical protein EU91_1407 [Prochlorococcus marinus str. GP2]|uniref:Uncharacterized protein n=1 Tax=Prochlorococcus marinus str. GP2 TaxID=59925 RepID=A0A0A1Z6T7_PROMR|nr:hypothetical protein EU91_1407 [Prochlorococcus marinus str. GP2]
MKKSLYLFSINLSLILSLCLIINNLSQLILFSIIFNIINIWWISQKIKKRDSITNFSKIINLLFNFSAIIFLYPDLLVNDPKLFFYGDELFIVQAFKLMIFYQFIVTIILKLFESLGFGDVDFKNFDFFNKDLIKTVIEINIFSFILYELSGKKILSILSGRASNVYGSFFKVPAYSGSTNTFFILFNYFIQFTAVIGSLYLLNYLFTKLIKGVKVEFLRINISDYYQFILFFITIIYYISAFYSDVRVNLLYVIIPVLILFSSLIFSSSNVNTKFSLLTIQTTKIITLTLLILVFLLVSQIQVYRRGGSGATFFKRQGYEFTKTQGIVQTDRNLYMLSEIIKFSPNNGTVEGRKRFANIPYQFVPSLIFPNKPRISEDIHRDVENSIINNFSYKYTNTSVSFTLLGNFILAYGKNLGFILSTVFTIIISYLNIFILSKFLSSRFYPYIAVSLLSVYFILSRSLFYYFTLISIIIYSLIILLIYTKLRKSI